MITLICISYLVLALLCLYECLENKDDEYMAIIERYFGKEEI